MIGQLPEGGLVDSWSPGQVMSVTEAHEGFLLASSGETVHCLSVDSTSGRLSLLRSHHCPQQVSALALFPRLDQVGQSHSAQG